MTSLYKYHHYERGTHKSIFEHTVIAEKVLGKKLPPKAEIHHVDGNGLNNQNSNLVICEDHAYHELVDRRARALKVCGYVHYCKCCYCKLWDHPDNIIISDNGTVRHKNADMCPARLYTPNRVRQRR